MRRMYMAAPYGEQSLAVIMFGIKYADDLVGLGIDEIVRQAELTRGDSYGVQIRHGMRLVKHGVGFLPDGDL